ncbi:aminotransferase class V-fold PLP-dependent enzyme [Lentiprolixibacter aurantiacus]|uniref:Aminotransferase class V-fold PLP-dependent enzyme n=1 Tax=Lentiprolixibacter aurantiacus TaxID=2993939 RepID=A0AAE3MLE1_9FLAO|nr:aminotransferase class V-fold PLP-dependent enzyme [Lentiprolixibacter aurantiacus]MCX2719107.1 aminotransferase class V-fold PLP-dependent enzyme [Lentiprolixibacter aurantiacus]
MEHLRKQFPVLSQGIYADTAASGLLYDDLLEWRQGHDLDFLIGGSSMKFESFDLVEETHGTLANFFNASSRDIALVPNFSLGLNLILEGLAADTRILLLDGDYPSVNWPFESRGYPIKYVPIDASLEDHIWKVLAEEPVSVFAFSLVQWLNGVRIDLNFLKELKAKYPELILIADGTQYLGALDFDFSNSGIDVMGASGYKWLLGGYGNGFYLFAPTFKEKTSLPCMGFYAAGGKPDQREQIPFSRGLEPGHLDSLNFGSLKFSLEWLSKAGMQNITAHNEALIQRAREAMAELGILESAITERKQHGPIFSVDPGAGLTEALREAGVFFSERGGRIRLSFHFYNTEKDVDRVVDLIRRQL